MLCLVRRERISAADVIRVKQIAPAILVRAFKIVASSGWNDASH